MVEAVNVLGDHGDFSLLWFQTSLQLGYGLVGCIRLLEWERGYSFACSQLQALGPNLLIISFSLAASMKFSVIEKFVITIVFIIFTY